MKERLLADFPRNEVRSALAMSDGRLVLRGFAPLSDSDTPKSLLRGVRELAPLLGCEETAAALQHNGVLRYMKKQMAPDQFRNCPQA